MKVTSQDILNLAQAFEASEARKYINVREELIKAILDTIRDYREQLREKENNNGRENS